MVGSGLLQFGKARKIQHPRRYGCLKRPSWLFATAHWRHARGIASIINWHDQNLSGSLPASACCPFNGLGHLFGHFIHNDYFTFDLWQNIDYIFSASVDSARSAWPLKSRDLKTVGPYMPTPDSASQTSSNFNGWMTVSILFINIGERCVRDSRYEVRIRRLSLIDLDVVLREADKVAMMSLRLMIPSR
jgi:hypothetical protein